LLRTVVILIEANIVAYVEKNQIQYHPHRNRSRDSLSQYTVYVATTRKSCRAWASSAHPLITSAGSDYLTVLAFFAIVINIDGRYGFFISVTMIILSVCCLIVIKKDWFLQVLGFNLECQFACKNMVLVICTCRP
jgi:hypothetical protein